MKKLYLFLTICVLGLSSIVKVQAQQIPLNYEYLINPYSLNPAYAGLNEGFEAYLDYKKDRMDMPWSPQTLAFDFNAPLSPKVGIGGSVKFDEASIFKNTDAKLSYTYHAKFGENHFLGLSLFGGILAKNVDLTGINTQTSIDPVLAGKQELKETSLNFGASLLWRLYGGELGFVAPALLVSNSTFYDYVTHYIIHASYNFDIAEDWQIEPLFMFRGAENSPWSYEVTAIGKYMEKYYMGLTYRKGTIGAISVGGFLTDNIVMHYAYDFTMPFDEYRGVIGNNRGGHEIAVGYRFNGRKPNKKDQILNELKEKSTIKQVDSLHNSTKELERQIQLLNDSLAKQQENMRKAVDESQLRKENSQINNNTIIIKQDVDDLNRKIDSLQSSLSEYNKKMVSKFRVLSTRDAVRDDNKPVDPGYYVVIGSFHSQENAKKAVQLYKDVNPFIIQSVSRNWYYVYCDRYDTANPAIERMKKLRTEKRFWDAWVHIYKD